jgi:hypothetical protein
MSKHFRNEDFQARCTGAHLQSQSLERMKQKDVLSPQVQGQPEQQSKARLPIKKKKPK